MKNGIEMHQKLKVEILAYSVLFFIHHNQNLNTIVTFNTSTLIKIHIHLKRTKDYDLLKEYQHQN